MKIQSVIIGFLLVLVGIMGYFLYALNSKKGNYEKRIYCNVIPSSGDGEIWRDNIYEAQAAIDKFDRRHLFPSIKAYHLGLDVLKAMVDSAKIYNCNEPDTTKKIVGYRFYNAITDRSNPSLKSEKDLIVSPTLKNGDDYFDLGYNTVYSHTPLTGVLQLYSKLRPCPRICGK